MNKIRNFAVIGGGSWGTALACLAVRASGETPIYTPENDTALEINNKHRNSKYLGNIPLPKEIVATTKIKDVLSADAIILATPSHAFVEILLKLKQVGLPSSTILLIATKGLCENPLQLFSSKIENELDNPYAFISGPNFAKEVAEDKFTSATIVSKDIKLAQLIASNLVSERFDVTSSPDIITVQVAGIVKNIVAIRGGMMKAQGAGENALAWLVSKGLEEIAIISKAIGGGNLDSLSLPAVVGDLVLTSYSTTSRNTKFGYEFHKSGYSKEFLAHYPTLVEGVLAARLLKAFVKKYNLDLPIISSVADIV